MKNLHQLIGGLGIIVIPFILIGDIWFDSLPTAKLILTDLIIIGFCIFLDINIKKNERIR